MGFLVPKVVATILLVYFIASRVRAYLRLAHIPGPPLRGWSRFLQAWYNGSGFQHENLREIRIKYGKLARIAPNLLVTSDPEVIMRMSASNSAYRRSELYSVFRFRPREDHVFSMQDEKMHTQHRRRVALGYSGKDVANVEQQIETHIASWISLIKRKYLSTDSDLKPANISAQASYFTTDVITDVAMDNCFGNLDLDEDRFKFGKTTKDAVAFMTMLTVFTEVFSFLEQSRIIDLLAPSLKDKEGLGPAMRLAKESIDKRLDNSELKQKPDMIGAWLRQGLSPREVESESILPL
jgi:cytochrome P450